MAYHVMTLSAIGDAETPAGGSVCIRYKAMCKLQLFVSIEVLTGQALRHTLKSRIRRRRAGVDMLHEVKLVKRVELGLRTSKCFPRLFGSNVCRCGSLGLGERGEKLAPAANGRYLSCKQPYGKFTGIREMWLTSESPRLNDSSNGQNTKTKQRSSLLHITSLFQLAEHATNEYMICYILDGYWQLAHCTRQYIVDTTIFKPERRFSSTAKATLMRDSIHGNVHDSRTLTSQNKPSHLEDGENPPIELAERTGGPTALADAGNLVGKAQHERLRQIVLPRSDAKST